MKFSKDHKRLKDILAHPDFTLDWGRHAQTEMASDQITHADVIHVLTKGQVTWFEMKQDDIVHVEGRDIDGRKIRLVVGLRDAAATLKLITVMELK